MPLWLIVTLLVTGVTVLLGVVGFVIDRSADRHERSGGR
jgi:hypothetical protein